ncbi:MAG: hypothetical protein AAF351_09905 [Pseudomonadota bacterium]
MISRVLIVILSSLLVAACSSEETVDDPPVETQPVASVQDFAPLQGEKWVGSLTYLDYGSANRVAIPINITCCRFGDDFIEYVVMYPDEPQYDSTAQIRLSADGSTIDEHRLIMRNTNDDGSLTLTTVGTGEDNGREATIRTEYVIGAAQLLISKDVRYDDSEAYFNRNIIELSR